MHGKSIQLVSRQPFNLFMFLTYIQSIFTYYKVSRKQVPDRDQKNQRRGPFQTIETISTISNQSMEQTPFLTYYLPVPILNYLNGPLLLILITIRNFFGTPCRIVDTRHSLTFSSFSHKKFQLWNVIRRPCSSTIIFPQIRYNTFSLPYLIFVTRATSILV